MPHSSGGGSHSGGSHSGGSHSSHSSHRSGGGSSSGGSSRRTSDVPFKGSRRYLYYRDNKPQFVYANYDVRKPNRMPLITGIIVFVFFLFPVLIGCIIGMVSSIKKPQRIDFGNYKNKRPEFVIEDNLGIFENKKKLKGAMEDFYDETGIIPAVITVSNEDWNEDYTSLESYAYDQYINRFKEFHEIHWLIVYSESTKDNGFSDWYWEGMQGDETDSILTEKQTAAFTESLHKRLLQRAKYSVEDAIGITLDEYRVKVMKTTVNTPMLLICLFMFLMFGGISFYSFTVAYKPDKVPEYYKNAKPCDLTMVYQEPCTFCGGIYIIGMHTTCPHCGAALPAHHYIKDEQGNVVELLK